MLSKRVINMIGIELWWATLWCQIPCDWNFTEKKLTPTKYKIRRWIAPIYICIYVGTTIYLGIGIIYSIHYDLLSQTSLFIHIMYWFCALLVATLNTFVVINPDLVCDCVNQMTDMNNKFTEMYINKETKHSDKRIFRTMLAFVFMAVTHETLAIFLFISNPQDPFRYYTYGLIEQPHWPIWYGTPFICIAMFFFGSAWTSHMVYMFSGFAWITTQSIWLAEVTKSDDDPTRKIKILNPNEVIHLYRTLQVLNILYNEWLRDIPGPLHIIVVAIVNIIANYGTITFFDEAEMPGYLSMPIISISCMLFMFNAYSVADTMYQNSVQFSSEWFERNELTHLKREKMLMKKFSTSCRPLMFEIGSFFFIQESTSTSLFEIVVSYTIDLLLSY